jgi:hypothetical protein
VPLFVQKDDGPLLRVHLGQEAAEHGLLYGLAAGVQPVKLLHQLPRLLLAIGEEELEGLFRLPQAACRVDAGGDAEGHLVGPARVAHGLGQKPEAHPGRGGHTGQALLGQGPVPAPQGGHVGDGAQSGQVGVLQGRGQAKPLVKGKEEEEGHPGPRGALPQARGVGGVEDHPGGRGFLGRVVVGDQDFHPVFHELLKLGVVGDAAVHGEEDLGGLEVLGYPFHEDPVALLEAVGDEGVDPGPQSGEGPHQDGRAREAIGIVVPVDADPLSLPYGLQEEVHGLFQAL